MDRLRLLLLGILRSVCRSRTDLMLENAALRHQLGVLIRADRPVTAADRWFWPFLHRLWRRWSEVLVVVKPETVRPLAPRRLPPLLELALPPRSPGPAPLRVLYAWFVIEHGRRRVAHFHVTDHPDAAWVVQQLREAFPFDTAPRHLVFDRDGTFSAHVVSTVKSFGTKPARTAPRSPWQNGLAERWIGSVRRELLDHVVVFNDRHLVRLLRDYVAYHHDDRTHLGLAEATPAGRPRQTRPVSDAEVIALPRLGGLHHRYEWRPRVGQGISLSLHIPHASINFGCHRSGRTAPHVFVTRSITFDDRRLLRTLRRSSHRAGSGARRAARDGVVAKDTVATTSHANQSPRLAPGAQHATRGLSDLQGVRRLTKAWTVPG